MRLEDLERLRKRVADYESEHPIDTHDYRLIRHLALALDEVCHEFDEVSRKLQMHRDKAEGNYWAWGGDGYDHPESLSCPIMIDPRKMMAILSHAKECENALKEIARLDKQAPGQFIAPCGHKARDVAMSALTPNASYPAPPSRQE